MTDTIVRKRPYLKQCAKILDLVLFAIGFPSRTSDETDRTTPVEKEFGRTISMPVTTVTLHRELVKDTFRGDLVLFFDIDGVLHPYQTETLEFTERLYPLLDKFPHIELVMCSDWRETIRQQLFEARVGERIANHFVGCTPLMSSRRYRRQCEVLEFCRVFRVKHFAVVDDRRDLYAPNFPNLVVTDVSDGITDVTVQDLIRVLSA
ncbi:MAG: HAD domain-containing protein [Porticoccaceae bacterium]